MANTWLSILFDLAASRSASVDPIKASLNLSTTIPQTTPPTENFQSEISTVVSVGAERFTLSSGGGSSLQISRSTNPAATAPALQQRLSYGNAITTVSPNTTLPNGATWVSQAVASYGSLVAVSLSPSDYGTQGGRGVVRFYRMAVDGSLAFLQDVTVGYLPDSIAFNSSGTQLVVANEGEPTANYTIAGVPVDRPGSIGIIDIRNPTAAASFTYTDLGFGGLSLPAGIRISGKPGLSTQATDIEPEYVSINGNFAYVTLQENNGVAKVNLRTRTIERVFDLGSVDFSTQLVDISDRDGTGNTPLIKPVFGNNVRGLRMADAIAAFTLTNPGSFASGKDYFITANEGDGRDYTGFNDEERRNTGISSRLKTLKEMTTTPYTAFGSRSASLFDASSGALLWDSGNTFQTLAIAAGIYDDTRSDDKGAEPEGVVVTKLAGRTYAIVGLERTTKSMLVVFDVSNPAAVAYVSSVVLPTSLSPEGLTVLEANRSPSGRPLLVVSNEVSNTLDYVDLTDLVKTTGAISAGAFTATMLKDVAGGDNLQISSLITNGEVTNGLQAGSSVFTPVGIFDGLGAYDNLDGTYSLLVNHELGNSNGYQYQVQVKAGSAAATTQTVTGARISRFVVAKDIDGNTANGYQSRVLAGGLAYDQVISPNASFSLGSGINRFCSANLVPAGQYGGRGFVDSLYLAGEETSNGRFFALDPSSSKLYHVPAFGLGGWESASAVDTGNANTVAVLLFDDTSGTPNYLYLWVGSKSAGSSDLLERNGLAANSGSLYAWKADAIANIPAGVASVALNTAISGGWVSLGSGSQIAALTTAAALRSLASSAGAMQFTRIEDGDVNPSTGKQVAFTTTGGSGADLYGNTQILDLASSFATDGLLASGANTSLRVVADADRLTGTARQGGIRNPDGLAWSANGSLYVQEDRSLLNGTDDGRFGSQEASIWKVDSITGDAVRWAQIDRSAVPTAFGQSDSAPTDIGNWESSGILDVSSLYGAAAGSYFLSDVQAHSLTNGNIVGPQYLSEGGQINLIQVVPTI
jgi:sugar lactone lactonase YvrE